MRAALFAHLKALALSQKPESPRRPLYLRRLSDDKRFYRMPSGIYQNREDKEYLTLELSRKVIASEVGGFALSSEEAPDFHKEGGDKRSSIGGSTP